MADRRSRVVEQTSSHDEGADRKVAKYAPTQWIYRNLTPYRIHASYGTGRALLTPGQGGAAGASEPVKVLSIPALGEAIVPHEDAKQYDTLPMRQLGQLELRPAPSSFYTSLPQAIVIYGWLAIALFVITKALLDGGGDAVPWRACTALAIFVPVVALLAATCRELHIYRRFRKYREAVADRAAAESRERQSSLEGVQHGSRIECFVEGAPRILAEKLVIAGALVVTVVGLGVAIHQTTQLNGLMPIDYAALFQLDDPFTGLDPATRASPAFWQLLVGHIAQWVLVSVAAIAPAAMYFQFDRQRLAAVQRQWIRDVFRLDPTVRTVRDIEAKYGSQIEASFGNVNPDSGTRLGRGRRSPIVVATILNVIGWFLVISTTDVPLLTTPAGASELQWADDGSFPVGAFFAPSLSLVGYAFLGAYVFGMLYTIRGYQRRDLRPRTYNTIVVRILVAYALAVVMSLVYDGPYAEIAMFFVGFMPQSALVWLRETVSSQTIPLIPLHEPAPLTDLEGIDLYDRTRLGEAGVNNVVSLAHADIIDLMSSTRTPAAELVDWTDQAILYLKVGGDAAAQFAASAGQRGTRKVRKARARGEHAATPPPAARTVDGTGPRVAPPDASGSDATPADVDTAAPAPPTTVATDHVPDVRLNLCHLRCFGIRTATDLTQAYRAAEERDGDTEHTGTALDALRAAFALPSGPQDTAVPPIQTIIDTIGEEEWFAPVENWHNSEFRSPDAWYHYLDGHDWDIQTFGSGDAGTSPTDAPPASARVSTNGDSPDAPPATTPTAVTSATATLR